MKKTYFNYLYRGFLTSFVKIELVVLEMNWILLKLSQKWQNYVKWRNITRAMCSPRPPSEGPSLKAACLLTELEIQLLLTGLWNNFSDDEISRKCQKNGFSGIFPTFSARNEFFPEIGLRHILGIAILHLCAKNQQKLMSQSREKLVTNERTDERTDKG